MKKILLLISIFLLPISCEKENSEILIGKWKFVRQFSLMSGSSNIDEQNQKIEEYTKDNKRILYDYLGNETTRCNYTSTNTTITLSGTELNGDTWSLSYDYWFVDDSLKIRHSGGFEFSDEYFIRIK